MFDNSAVAGSVRPSFPYAAVTKLSTVACCCKHTGGPQGMGQGIPGLMYGSFKPKCAAAGGQGANSKRVHHYGTVKCVLSPLIQNANPMAQSLKLKHVAVSTKSHHHPQSHAVRLRILLRLHAPTQSCTCAAHAQGHNRPCPCSWSCPCCYLLTSWLRPPPCIC